MMNLSCLHNFELENNCIERTFHDKMNGREFEPELSGALPLADPGRIAHKVTSPFFRTEGYVDLFYTVNDIYVK